MIASSEGGRVLLLHLPGVDWKLAQPLVDAGSLPHLEALVERGTLGGLQTPAPRIGPAMASGIATGCHADRHGVLGYHKPNLESPLGLGVVTSSDLEAAPVWELAARAGRKTAAVGWPVSFPATAFQGLVVSDAFADAQGEDFDAWPMLRESVSDSSLAETLAELRVHPSEVTPEMVLPFVPEGSQIDQETDERLALIVASLSRNASLHGAATWIAEHQDWHLLAVHLDLVERLTSAFLPYRAPQTAKVTDKDFAIYRDVVDGAYRFMDMMLGRYLELVGPKCQIVLASAHGYLQDDRRRTGGQIHLGYQPESMLVLAGPNVKQDELLHGAHLHDVVPTILTLLGSPVPIDLPGQVLSAAFTDALPVTETEPTAFQASWKPDEEARLWEGRRLIEYAALSYHPLPPSEAEQACEASTVVWQTNLSMVRMQQSDYTGALAALAVLLEIEPDHSNGLRQKAYCNLVLKDLVACREALNDAAAAGHTGAQFDSVAAQLAVAEGNPDLAQELLAKAQANTFSGVSGQQLLESIGVGYLSSKDLPKAEQAFRQAFEINSQSVAALNGLASALLGQRKHEEAAEYFRKSLARRFEQAEVHCDLGQCLYVLGHLQEATASYRQSLKLNPKLFVPKTALAVIEKALATS